MTKPKKKPKKAGNCRARFVDEFMLDRNATEAAIRAGYSAKSARTIGPRLLRDVAILAEVNKRGAERSQRLGITADRIMQEYERLALLDVADLFNPNGTMKRLDEMPEDARRAISGIEIMEEFQGRGEDRVFLGYVKKLKLADKKGALDSLAKIMGLMKEKVEHSGTVTIMATPLDERL